MKLKKAYIGLFTAVINSTTPRFTEARFRDKFIKVLASEIEQYENDRLALCKAFCEKDTKGEPLLVQKANQNGLMADHYTFSEDGDIQFNKEFELLKAEEINFPLEGDEPLRLIRLIESTNYLPQPGEAAIIDDEIIGAINKKKTEPEKTPTKKKK